jgi:hypothetical protein
MAKGLQNTTQNVTRSFSKGMNKDADPSFVGDGMWTHARNATNNTDEGNIGTLSNEQSNVLCATAGLTMPATAVDKYIIGTIQLYSDKWIVFTAGHDSTGIPVMSEIGLLETDNCIYRPIVQDACLKFDKRYLISGASREKEDCTWQVYFADGLNPDRVLNVGDPQTWPTANYYWIGQSNINYYSNGTNVLLWPGVKWKQICTDETGVSETQPDVWPSGHPIGCITCVDINQLDCEKIRLARLMKTPCLNLIFGNQGGTLRNGTYFATIAYSIKGQKVTDYFSQSNNQQIWTSQDLQGSLVLELEADSVNFDEFILVIVQNINQGTVAKQIGIYSTRTTIIALDQIKEDLITVPLEQLPIQTPVFEKSDQIAEVNNYLLRVGPTSKFDFNYQPLANLIRARWASVEYPSDYYVKNGNKASYLRDEVYCFFIRWVYDTGDKSASYHIPGRAPGLYNGIPEDGISFNENALSASDNVFEVFNTASIGTIPSGLSTTTDDGGTVIAVGNMGYWESTEKYPDNTPEIWNTSFQCWTGFYNQPSNVYDLCGDNIRHHKFPDNCLDPSANKLTNHFKPTVSNQPNELKIRLLGVYFENIAYPKDNEGNDIPGIIGYEILRGSREGNKSIIAKGMLNNFRTYDIVGQVNNPAAPRKGIYANYPFNTIKPFYNTGTGTDHNRGLIDPYIRIPDPNDPQNSVLDQNVPLDFVSFHSPDTSFRTPFLSATELKIYGYLRGASTQRFIEPNQHPKFKLFSDLAIAPMFVVGIAEAIVSVIGKRTFSDPSVQSYTEQMRGTAGVGAINLTLGPTGVGQLTSGTSIAGAGGRIDDSAAQNTALGLIRNLPGGITSWNQFWNTYYSSGNAIIDVPLMIAGGFPLTTVGIATTALRTVLNNNANNAGIPLANQTGTIELPNFAYLPAALRIASGVSQLLFYFSEGANLAADIIRAIIPYTQYALQMIAHGFYSDMRSPDASKLFRFNIEDSSYIRDNIMQMPGYYNAAGTFQSYSINNLKRSDAVVIRTDAGPNYAGPYSNGVIGPNYILESLSYVDQSLTTLGHIQQNGLVNAVTLNSYFPNPNVGPNFEYKDANFALPIASHYAAMKVRIQNQYGQLQAIKQIVITPCEQKFNYNTLEPWGPYNQCGSCNLAVVIKKINITPIFFGGDVYINRYTEKNSMFFFYDWLYGQPDGFEYNYAIHQMIPEPRFYVNSKKYEVSDLNPANLNAVTPGTGAFPTRFYRMDHGPTNTNPGYDYTDDTAGDYPGVFRPKDSYFYLAVSSVRDFFVESDVIVDYREAGDYEWEKHYDPYRYTQLSRMFDMNPDIITRGNWYRYDYSLSVSKLYNQYFSSGNLQNRYYNPNVSQLCYTYLPDRIYYSLQQQDESFKDSWFIFLPNNYREFKSQISGVKSINKSGLFITFKNDSPQMFQGVDTLQTDLGTKITIGDGGLFSQPAQSVSNADRPYEYGSSQSRLGVISTPAGLFYASQNQGKLFSYGGGLKEISQVGLKWWYSMFLRCKLITQFPDYPWQDNPVAGVGVQAVYDNENSRLYFSKKDYIVKDGIDLDRVDYVPLVVDCRQISNGKGYRKGQGDFFTLDGNGRYLLGDPAIFESASWTASYDPKNEMWISFHDWHPDLVMPSKTIFLTTKKNSFWKHNYVCDSYCKFYGIEYPFEIETPIVTGQSPTVIKSFEYIIEAYKHAANCVDQFQVLDYNFDTAIVHNAEQVSGYLNLNIFPKNNITLSLEYPKFNPSIPMIIRDTVVGLPGFDILFSKEENKYRFNQFWDVTRDRGEFPIGSGYPPQGPLVPGTTELLGNYPQEIAWITLPDGYRRELNLINLDYNKAQLQRKKFRHYLNYITLRKEISGNINMVVKVLNSKNQSSLR